MVRMSNHHAPTRTHIDRDPDLYVQQDRKAPRMIRLRTGILLGLLLLFAGIGIGVSSKSGDTTTSTVAAAQGTGKPAPGKPVAAAPAKAAPAAPKVGAQVRDGKFEFVVTKVKYGAKRVGDEYVGQDAQGQFVLVSLTVQNIGDSAQTFSAATQYAHNAKGQKYDADTGAGIYLKDSNSLLEQINPNSKVKGTLVFDIPAGEKLSNLELHDSMFSDGVTVAL